jgi:diguanylate cyclase (GGDEF)-like protein
LVGSNSYQQVINVDAYLENIKETGSLFFSDEIYYKYDATDDENGEFEKIQAENAIVDRIQDLGVLQNYADFGVVYANNHTVGWISTESYKLFNDGEMYAVFASKITDSKTESGWFADFNNLHNTIYYVKRLNENAILFTSFYARELESVFEVPEDLSEMHIRLVDEDNVVLYSNDKDEIGGVLDDTIAQVVATHGDGTTFDSDYLVTANSCNKGKWELICSMPDKVVMREVYASRTFTYIFSAGMLVVVLLVAFFTFRKVSDPMGELVAALAEKAEKDQLTGLFNKVSFQSTSMALLEQGKSSDTYVFVMMDMDNFKKVNDSMGHKIGDEVLMRLASLVKRCYSPSVIKGRLGGDEFALFVCFSGLKDDEVRSIVDAHMDEFRGEFAQEFAEERESCSVSLSAGIVLSHGNEMDFETMYKSADKALYKSKRDGKDRITYYEDINNGKA